MAGVPPRQRLSFLEHRVRKGDTLSKIAVEHGSTVEAILGFNRLSSPRALKVNSTLMIPVPAGARRSTVAAAHSSAEAARSARRPPPVRAQKARASSPLSVHVIHRGDTLWSVSKQYGVTVADLKKWNGIRDHRAVRVGQKLRVAAP